MSEQRLSDEEMGAALRLARSLRHEGGPRSMLGRALLQVAADLAAETATRTALRTQEARISGLLADAGVPVGDLVEGVGALVTERDAAARAASDVAHEQVARERRRADAAEGERDDMRSARDVLLTEVDRLRARLADAEARAEGLDVTEHHGVAR